MKKEYTLTAFEDHNGLLGWAIGSLDNTFEELDACVDGRLLAHDLLEHNHDSNLKGIANELQAIGAARYVRSDLEFDSDLLFMASYALQYGLDVPRGTIEEICPYMLTACENFDSEFNLEDYDTEERKNLRDYIKYASTYMEQGFEWASKYYANHSVNYMFREIQEKFIEPEHEGEQAKIYLDFTKSTVHIEEFFEFDEYDEEY